MVSQCSHLGPSQLEQNRLLPPSLPFKAVAPAWFRFTKIIRLLFLIGDKEVMNGVLQEPVFLVSLRNTREEEGAAGHRTSG